MVGYRPTIHRSAKRELAQLPDSGSDRLTSAIADVAQEREPSGHEKAEALEGQPGLFRVRVGDYRAILSRSGTGAVCMSVWTVSTNAGLRPNLSGTPRLPWRK